MKAMKFWPIADLVAPQEVSSSPLVQTEPLTSAPVPDIGGAFIHMLLTFVAIIALLFGTYWFIRRLIQYRLQKGVGNQAIHVLEKKMLSPKTMLYLVEVENKKILLAESHLEIKRLESFSDQTICSSTDKI